MFEVEKIKRKALLKYPFFGGLVAGCRMIETEKLPTAATDGKNIFINPKFMETLDEKGQEFVLEHEILHIACNHILRSEGKDKRLWNIATDAVINQMLRRDGGIIPVGGVDKPEAINKKAETIYDRLVKEAEEKRQQENEQARSGEQQQGENGQGSGQGQGSSGEMQNANQSGGSQSSRQSQGDEAESQAQSGEGNSSEGGKCAQGQGEKSREGDGGENENVGHDEHDLWEEAVKNYREGKGLKSDFEKELQGEESEEEKKQDEERQKRIEQESQNGEDQMSAKNDQMVKEQLEKMIENLGKKAASNIAGKGASSTFKNFEEVGKARPLINWKRYLRESAKINADWSYRDGEFENNVLNARLIKYAEPETEIMLDVSGSVSEELLKNFLRECKNILQVSRIKVGQFNTQFIDFQEVRCEKDIENIKFNIGGGTDFNVAVENFSRRAANKIIFTDGKADMPKESCRAIWVVFGGKKISPKGGKVIEISTEALAKLQAPKTSPFSR